MGSTGKKTGRLLGLTGTPGTGKTSASLAFRTLRMGRARPPQISEIADLAIALGCGSRDIPRGQAGTLLEGGGTRSRNDPGAGHGRAGVPTRSTVHVDMRKLSRKLRERPDTLQDQLVVGHLAHLLPVDAVLLLRCNPLEIGRRLRLRGDGEGSVLQNMEAEWTDVVLFEALRRKAPIYEHDTTRETPEETALWIVRVWEHREAPSHGTVDWLGESPPNGTTPTKPISMRGSGSGT